MNMTYEQWESLIEAMEEAALEYCIRSEQKRNDAAYSGFCSENNDPEQPIPSSYY